MTVPVQYNNAARVQRGLPARASAPAVDNDLIVFASAQTISALPATVNLQLYAGDDVFLDLTVSNPDGTDADLSNAEASAQIRSSANDEVILASFDATIDGNVIRLHLPHDAATDLPHSGVWDCQIEAPEVTTLVAGTVTVTSEVTRP